MSDEDQRVNCGVCSNDTALSTTQKVKMDQSEVGMFTQVEYVQRGKSADRVCASGGPGHLHNVSKLEHAAQSKGTLLSHYFHREKCQKPCAKPTY